MTYGFANIAGVALGRPVTVVPGWKSWPSWAQTLYTFAVGAHVSHALDFSVALLFYLAVWPAALAGAAKGAGAAPAGVLGALGSPGAWLDLSPTGWVARVFAFNIAAEFLLVGFWHQMCVVALAEPALAPPPARARARTFSPQARLPAPPRPAPALARRTYGGGVADKDEASGPLADYKFNKQVPYGPKAVASGERHLRREVFFQTLGWLQAAALQVAFARLYATGAIGALGGTHFWAGIGGAWPSSAALLAATLAQPQTQWNIASVLLVTYWREIHFVSRASVGANRGPLPPADSPSPSIHTLNPQRHSTGATA